MTQLTEILHEVKELREQVAQLMDDRLMDLQEVSLNKASRLMSCSTKRLKRAIQRGELRARQIQSGSRVDYRITVASIKSYQNQQQQPIKTPDMIWEECKNETEF
jgi:predicted DNA-binding protein (UPF0251 family)